MRIDKKVSQRLAKAFQAIASARRGDQRQTKALGMTTGAGGGYLVPTQLLLNVEDFLNEVGIFYKYAQRYDMTEGELLVPGVDTSYTVTAAVDGVAAGDGDTPLFGGMKLTWSTEGNFGTVDRKPKFSMTRFVARDVLGGILTVPNQMLDDGGANCGRYIERLLGEALEWHVERSCWRGLGINGENPVGVVNADSTVAVTRSGASTVARADVSGMQKALYPACYGRAIWGCNPGVVDKLMQITGFQLTTATMLTAEGLEDIVRNPTRLVGFMMNRPVFATEKLPTLGTRGDLVLFDPSLYGLATRCLEVEASEHSKFSQNATDFRVVWRGDGNSLMTGTATSADGTSTIGAAAVLTTSVS